MITIKVKQDPQSDLNDLNYTMQCKISIPEEASVQEAAYAFIRALEADGYAGPRLAALRDAVDRIQ